MRDTCNYKLYFITNNVHKVEEVKLVAREYSICIEQAAAPKIEIQSNDLEPIAINAAIKAYSSLRKPVLVEDAGLFIESLNGFPGPYSSYVFKTIGIKGVIKLLNGIQDRRAYFKSVVVIIAPPAFIIEEGIVYGVIASQPRGNKGFGFDPIFIPEGLKHTFAELSIVEKNMYSHRAIAVRKAFTRLRDILKI